MSEVLPSCPQCDAAYTYESGLLLACPMCGHEWAAGTAKDADENVAEDAPPAIRDAVGNVLVDGDTVTISKDLKVKGGGGGAIKVGTKVRGIRLIEPVDGHDIDATVPGFGAMKLKSSVVKKVL
ncbi:MAG: zinc ribbon domain-containing protein YjdM [Brachybacterium sp.]